MDGLDALVKRVEIKNEDGATTAVNGHMKREVTAASAMKKPSPAAPVARQSGLLHVNRPIVLLGAKKSDAMAPAATNSGQLKSRSKVRSGNC